MDRWVLTWLSLFENTKIVIYNKKGLNMKDNIIAVTYKIPKSLKNKIKIVADYKGVSMNAVIIDYLENGLKLEHQDIFQRSH